MAAMTWPLTATAAALVPSGSTARRDRTTRSYLIWRPPAEARRAVRRIRRLVLAADPAGVALRGELAKRRLKVQYARPGRATVRDVGDLDVRDAGRLAGQRARQVLAHLAQVVQVGQERHVGDAGLRPPQADHLQRAPAGDQRRLRAVVGVQRLDDHGRSGPRGGPRG